jgi:hypothetical protein
MAASDAMAGRFLLPAMRPSRIHAAGTSASVSMRGLPLSSFFDCGNDFSQNQDAIGEVVLVDLPDGYVQDRCLYFGDAERTGGP